MIAQLAATAGAVGVAVLGGMAAIAYRRDISAARQRLAEPDVTVHRLPVPAGVIEYAQYGHGPAVLVVHGSGGGWDQGVDWARRRLGGNRQVIAVSRFGYLGSSLPVGATTSAQADAFVELLDALEIDRADVVALSAGSASAVRFAGRHPDRVRSLVLESPIVPTRRPPRLPPVAVVRLLARAQPLLWALTRSPLLTGLAAGVPRRQLNPAQREELAAINATLLPLPPRAAGMVFDSAVTGPEMISGQVPVDGVRAPTLIVNAQDAVMAPRADAEAFAAALPRGVLVNVPTGGHVLVGNVAYLRGVLVDFFAEAGRP